MHVGLAPVLLLAIAADRRPDAVLQPPRLPVIGPVSHANTSTAFLDRSVLHLGDATNAHGLIRAHRDRRRATTLLVIGSSVSGAFAGCTDPVAPFNPGCTSCGADCGAPANDNIHRGWMRLFASDLDSGAIDGFAARESSRVINAGRGGGDITHFADCLDSYSPPNVDLVVIELAAFRSHIHESTVSSTSSSTRMLEHLVRQLKERKPAPTVVLLRSLTTWYCDNRHHECTAGDRMHDGADAPNAAQAQRELSALAAHYGVALIDQYAALQQRPGALRPSTSEAVAYYSFAHLAQDAAAFRPERVLLDSVHPRQLGVRLLTDLLAHAVRKMAALPTAPTRSAESRAASGAALVEERPLPSWLFEPSGQLRNCHACFAFDADPAPAASSARQQTAVTAAVRSGAINGARSNASDDYVLFGSSPLPSVPIESNSGWRYVVEWSKNGHAKRGLAASLPGSAVTLRVDTRPLSGCARCRPYVLLEYLASFEHMGVAQVECAGGCHCLPAAGAPAVSTMDAHWTSHTSEPKTVLLQVTAAAACLLNVTLLNATSSGEHRFKLTGLRVGEIDEV